MNPTLCYLYWNQVLMLDDLMIRGAVMICAGMDLRLFYTVCTMMCCHSRFIFLSVGPLSLDWRFFWRFLCFFACVPPRYFLPISTLDSCLALTSNLSHASLAIPSLKYLQFSFNQTAAASIWVGPFFGSWARHSAFDTGKTIF